MPEPRRLIRRRPDDSAAEPKQATRRYDEEDDREDDEQDEDQGLVVAKGWEGHKQVKNNAPSKYAQFYKPPEQGEGLIMFLEDEPYASFLLHYCDWLPRGGRFSYVCLQRDCPLCEVDTPSMRDRFNILDCSALPQPKLYTYEVGPQITNVLEKYVTTVGPLGGSYYGVSVTGVKQSKRTLFRPVKKRDLVDDWKFDPLTPEQIARYAKKPGTAGDIETSSRQELREIANKAVD